MVFEIKKIDLSMGVFSMCLRDLVKLRNEIMDNKEHIKAAVEWIKYAQDITNDAGVSAGYFYGIGWQPSFPEVTGYIIPTMFDYYHFAHDDDCRKRAIRMSDWLVNIQLRNGAFPGGLLGASSEPLVFDTGQCMHGLIRSYNETKQSNYLESATRAGNWLVEIQDMNGSWTNFAYRKIPHTYYTRVAWPLLELYELVGDTEYKTAAFRNIEWALANSRENGWFSNCAFDDRSNPFTHTIAYTAEGILESGVLLDSSDLIGAAARTMSSLLRKFELEGYLCGSYDEKWETRDNYSCLTGDAQIAAIWLRFFGITKDPVFLKAAMRLNNFLKASQFVRHPTRAIRGAIKGSQPVYGRYFPFALPVWASKFFIDALLREEKLEGNKS